MSLRPTSIVFMIMVVIAATHLPAGAIEPTDEEIRASIARALVPIQTSVKEYPHQRDCFSCHHQAVPLVALSLARERGLPVDPAAIDASVEVTDLDLESALELYRQGKGQPGGVTRAGYALWTLSIGGREPVETTEAVADYLLRAEADRDHWTSRSVSRPPSEGSGFTATYVALRGLQAFGTAAQRDRIDARRARAREWLTRSEGANTEDRVFRLRALRHAGADEPVIRSAADRLRSTQRPDGGWAQLDGKGDDRDRDRKPEPESDAYATGSALVALASRPRCPPTTRPTDAGSRS